MRIFTVFPLMIIPVAIYNVIAISGSEFATADAVRDRMNEDFLQVPMASDALWVITPGHALIALSILLLFFEVVKSAQTGRDSILNHAFSLVLLLVCVVEFLMFASFATSVFFLISLMALLDVMAGFTITTIASRRDVSFSDHAGMIQ